MKNRDLVTCFAIWSTLSLKMVAVLCNCRTAQLPPEIGDWQAPLRLWAKQQLGNGETEILKKAVKVFEKTLLDSE